MDNNLRTQLENFVKTELANRHLSYITLDEEQSVFNAIFGLYSFFLTPYKEQLKLIIREYVVNPDNITQIVNSENEQSPWILEYKKNNKMPYWRGYCQYLSSSTKVNLSQLDYETDMIMDNLINPKSYQGNFDKRGLVFGNVQSGKTSNFIGLINKAADTGYRLIIVLSGMYGDLRKQTQERIDVGFIGCDTGNSFRNWGNTPNVAKFHQQNDGWNGVNSYTSSHIDGDINMAAIENMNFNMHNDTPFIFVCKKNHNVLNALLHLLTNRMNAYLDESGCSRIGEIPLLLIDDEADSASVNGQYNPEEIEEATKINAQIRCLLNMFDKSAYVGYTATPYANILMPKNANNETLYYEMPYGGRLPYGLDLFPNDFLINLKTNSNYIGADEIFKWDDKPVLPMISKFNDDELKYYDVFDDSELPPSVRKAIMTYIASTAVRILRGQKQEHSTMLFHVDRFIVSIDQWARKINRYILSLKEEIGANTQQGRFILEIIYKHVYLKDLKCNVNLIDESLVERFGKICTDTYTKEDFDAAIYKVLQKIEVRSIHSERGDQSLNLPPEILEPLNYKDYENRENEEENGLYVIAVGGNKLSRGLTLEGLVVSFFYRYTKSYDTLIQMGRWFGYRPGYYDVCRLFITHELEMIFNIMSNSTKQLRDDIENLMHSSATPRDVVMKIKIGGGMLPTAHNRMGDGFMMPSSVLEGHKSTSIMNTDRTSRIDRLNVCLNFFNKLGKPEFRADRKNNYLWENISGDEIVEFVRKFNNKENPSTVVLDLMLEKKMKDGLITNWTVVLVNNSRRNYGKHTFNIMGKDLEIFLTKRKNISTNPNLYSLPRGIFSGKDEGLDMNQDQVALCNHSYEIRQMRKPQDALLVIYPMLFDVENEDMFNDYQEVPLMGYAMSFPEAAVDVPEVYVVSGFNMNNDD